MKSKIINIPFGENAYLRKISEWDIFELEPDDDENKKVRENSWKQYNIIGKKISAILLSLFGRLCYTKECLQFRKSFRKQGKT